jgi:hypothetical protein
LQALAEIHEIASIANAFQIIIEPVIRSEGIDTGSACVAVMTYQAVLDAGQTLWGGEVVARET